jgi:hypothetical protein
MVSPGRESIVIWPWWRSTMMRRAMSRPSPWKKPSIRCTPNGNQARARSPSASAGTRSMTPELARGRSPGTRPCQTRPRSRPPRPPAGPSPRQPIPPTWYGAAAVAGGTPSGFSRIQIAWCVGCWAHIPASSRVPPALPYHRGPPVSGRAKSPVLPRPMADDRRPVTMPIRAILQHAYGGAGMRHRQTPAGGTAGNHDGATGHPIACGRRTGRGIEHAVIATGKLP